jgi:cyclic-di-GMP phosphodiesterase TipF (flagellum assembly factor)
VLEGQIKQMGNELSTASGAIPTGAGEVYRAQTSLPPGTDEIEALADEAGAFEAAVGVDVNDLTVEFGDDVEDLTVERGSDVEDLTVELDDDVEELTVELGSDVEELTVVLDDVEPESGLEQSAEDEAEPLDLGVHAIAMEEETPAVLELKEDLGPVSEESVATPETLETVREAIEANRIDLYVQPAVALPERDPVYYEAFTRLRTADDEQILPATFKSVAESAGLMPLIDKAMLVESLQFVRRVGEGSGIKGVFCNLSVQSLLDSDYFPEFVALMEENSSLSDSLFFELGQNAVRDLGADGLQAMKTLGELGFRFGLDHVADLDVDFAGLRDRNFRFVKIEAQTLLHDMAESGASIPASDLKSYLQDFDLELIVEKVEDELSLIRLVDLGVEIAQGPLFAEPERVGPELYRKLQGIDAS